MFAVTRDTDEVKASKPTNSDLACSIKDLVVIGVSLVQRDNDRNRAECSNNRSKLLVSCHLQ